MRTFHSASLAHSHLRLSRRDTPRKECSSILHLPYAHIGGSNRGKVGRVKLKPRNANFVFQPRRSFRSITTWSLGRPPPQPARQTANIGSLGRSIYRLSLPPASRSNSNEALCRLYKSSFLKLWAYCIFPIGSWRPSLGPSRFAPPITWLRILGDPF